MTKGLCSWLLLWIMSWAALGQNDTQRYDEPHISADEVVELLENLDSIIQQHYLFPEKQKLIRQQIVSAQLQGKLLGAMPFGQLKIQLEALLIEASQDSNFEIHYGTRNLGSNGLSAPVTTSSQANDAYPDKFTVAIEQFDQVGYLALRGNFLSLSALPDIDSALQQLSHIKALIIDLSSVGEGNMPLIQHLLGYWLSPDIPFLKLSFNQAQDDQLIYPTGQSEQMFSEMPTYVINSSFVIGPWEAFAYSLQQFDKAQVLGQDSMGLAYVTRQVQLSNSIRLTMAVAIPSHPISGENWYQQGVLPDYPVVQDEALAAAIKLATAH